MSAPSEDVFSRAARLAERAGASEIDVDLLSLALDFEAGPSQPPDLAKLDALLSRYQRNVPEIPGGHSLTASGATYASGWIGLSKEVRAAIEPFGGVESITISDLRRCLAAVRAARLAANAGDPVIFGFFLIDLTKLTETHAQSIRERYSQRDAQPGNERENDEKKARKGNAAFSSPSPGY
jgi:hypothetical protein